MTISGKNTCIRYLNYFADIACSNKVTKGYMCVQELPLRRELACEIVCMIPDTQSQNLGPEICIRFLSRLIELKV